MNATNGPSEPRVARPVRAEWVRLTAPPSHGEPVFDPSTVADLPEPARRWLVHAITPGTPLWRSVTLTMRGKIRIGAWRSFTATQVIAPSEGYVWAATARIFALPVTGFDRLTGGTGEMRWRLLNMIPVVTARGDDVTRSAAGRLATETVFVPRMFRLATWTTAEEPDTAVGTWRIGPDAETARYRLGPQGEMAEVRLDRWGNPDGPAYGRYPFGASIEAERVVQGVAIPSEFRAGWWWGTERQDVGEFFRAHVTDAHFH
jgi:uncharacterized protein DUF6544